MLAINPSICVELQKNAFFLGFSQINSIHHSLKYKECISFK